MNLLYVVAKAEYFLSHRLALAKQAQSAGFKVSVATTEFLQKDRCKLDDINPFFLNFNRGGVNPFNELKTIMQLFFAVKKLRPNIVHNVALKPVLYGALIARLFKIPSVNAINGFGYLFTSCHAKARIIRPLVKLALKGILNHEDAEVILQNQQDYEDCRKLLPKCKLYLVPGSGVDTKAFYPVSCQGVFTFTLVARMLWSKGVGEFVEAARVFSKNNPDKGVRFLLVGSPDPENPESIPLKVLEQWRNEGVVEWLEYSDNIQDVYAQSHVAVLPSYREGLPKSLLEAMACGLPIITTNAVGCRDIVSKNNGVTVPTKNVPALAKAFEDGFAKSKEWAEMGQRGRNVAEKLYDVEIVNLRIVNIYSSILSKKRNKL